jgi:hypothetical protein
MEHLVTRNNVTWGIAAICLVGILVAASAMFLTKGRMNETADRHGMSAGRPGDAKPNLIQEQQDKASARGPTTSGRNPDGSVPPAR